MERRRIPNRLRKYRRWAGFSQGKVAKELGVSPSCISHWELGIDFPGIYIFHLSALYKTTPYHLYFEYLESLELGHLLDYFQLPEPVFISKKLHRI